MAHATIQNNGFDTGGPSALFVYDTQADELTPVFETSPRGDGWLGPVTFAVSLDRRLLFVGWRDARVPTDLGVTGTSFAVVDLERFGAPVNPRDLRTLFSTDNVAFGIHPTDWTTGNLIAINYGDSADIVEISALDSGDDAS